MRASAIRVIELARVAGCYSLANAALGPRAAATR